IPRPPGWKPRMKITLWNRHRLRSRLLTCFGSLVLSLAVPAFAAEPIDEFAVESINAPAKGAPPAAAVPASPATLAELRALALQTQRALKAYRASLASAEAKAAALERMRLAAVLRHDLHTRREQAAQGIVAAEAQLHKAEEETLYSVTRT